MQRLGLGALLSAALLGLFRFLILSFIATQAAATDFTAPLLNEEGKPVSICRKYDFPGIATGAPTGPKQCVEEVPLSIGQTIFDALNQPEKSLTNDGIVSRGLLALKVRAQGGARIGADALSVPTWYGCKTYRAKVVVSNAG